MYLNRILAFAFLIWLLPSPGNLAHGSVTNFSHEYNSELLFDGPASKPDQPQAPNLPSFSPDLIVVVSNFSFEQVVCLNEIIYNQSVYFKNSRTLFQHSGLSPPFRNNS